MKKTLTLIHIKELDVLLKFTPPCCRKEIKWLAKPNGIKNNNQIVPRIPYQIRNQPRTVPIHYSSSYDIT